MKSSGWLQNRLQDLRYGWRTLAASRGFTAVAILTLALGIGAATAIFSVVNVVLLAPLPYQAPDRLVMVWGENKRSGDSKGDADLLPVSGGDFSDWKSANRVLSDLAASTDALYTVTGAGDPQLVVGYRISKAYFALLGTTPELGRTFTAEEDRPGGPPVAVLSDRLWRNLFHADATMLGKSVTLDGKPYTVIGVMPPAFRYPQAVEVWTPLALKAADLGNYRNVTYRLLARLKPGVSLAQAQAQMSAIQREVARRHADTDAERGVRLMPLREEIAGDVTTPLLVLAAAVGCLLLIACANVSNLFLVRGTGRRAEVALRAALGATRPRLAGQFLTEGLLLSCGGGLLGVLFAYAARAPLLSLFPKNIANLQIPEVSAIPIDGRVLALAVALVTLAGLLFGSAPALQHGQPRLELLREGARGGAQGRRGRRLLSSMAAGEIALALVLLTAAGLVIASFQNLTRGDLGFRPDHLAAAEVFLPRETYPSAPPTQRLAFVDNVLARVRALPGVRSAAVVDFLPLSGFWGSQRFVAEGSVPLPGQEPSADSRSVTSEYFATMNVPLIAGRGFDAADRADRPLVAIVSREVAHRVWGAASPIGRRLNLSRTKEAKWVTVVGEVGDVRAHGLTEPLHGDLYQPLAQQSSGLVSFVVRTAGDAAGLTRQLETAIWAEDRGLPIYKALTLQSLADESLAVRRVSMLLLTVFSVLALAIAAVGVYGVVAFSVAQRTHEIGVRMALGARPAQVLGAILAQGLRIVAWGLGCGLLIAFSLTRLLGSLLYGVAANDAPTLVAVCVVLGLIALAASYLPARRAAAVDPMMAMRGPGAR